MQYVEALTEYEPGPKPAVFLAGGITGCSDWQQEIVTRLHDLPVVLLNPRRAIFRSMIQQRHLSRSNGSIITCARPTPSPSGFPARRCARSPCTNLGSGPCTGTSEARGTCSSASTRNTSAARKWKSRPASFDRRWRSSTGCRIWPSA